MAMATATARRSRSQELPQAPHAPDVQVDHLPPFGDPNAPDLDVDASNFIHFPEQGTLHRPVSIDDFYPPVSPETKKYTRSYKASNSGVHYVPAPGSQAEGLHNAMCKLMSFNVAAIAKVTDLPKARVRSHLEGMVERRVCRKTGPGQYQMVS